MPNTPDPQDARAEALLLRFAAEAHRRKWSYDRGLDDDGVPIKSEAFDALHRLGEEMRTALEELRRRPAASPSAAETTNRAALLREAADRLEERNPDRSADFSEGVDWALDELRAMADGPSRPAAEEQPAETQDGDRVKAIADAIGPVMLLGLQDAELFDEPGQERIRDWIKWISETVAALPAPAPVDRAAVLEEAAQLAVAENQTCPVIYQCQPCLTRERIAADLLRAAAKERPAVGEQPDTQTREAVTVHAVPLPGSNGISSCCSRPPCEFVGERLTRDPAEVTCGGPQ